MIIKFAFSITNLAVSLRRVATTMPLCITLCFSVTTEAWIGCKTIELVNWVVILFLLHDLNIFKYYRSRWKLKKSLLRFLNMTVSASFESSFIHVCEWTIGHGEFNLYKTQSWLVILINISHHRCKTKHFTMNGTPENQS